jgi:hypothetical protein
MSNEYKDWMHDGGPCQDCRHNAMRADGAICLNGRPEHREHHCLLFEPWLPSPDPRVKNEVRSSDPRVK